MAALPKISIIVLKPHFLEKKNHLVVKIHWYKWKDMPLPTVCVKKILKVNGFLNTTTS